jgi:hypothetical protein
MKVSGPSVRDSSSDFNFVLAKWNHVSGRVLRSAPYDWEITADDLIEADPAWSLLRKCCIAFDRNAFADYSLPRCVPYRSSRFPRDANTDNAAMRKPARALFGSRVRSSASSRNISKLRE